MELTDKTNLFFDKNGNPISIEEGCALLEDGNARRIALTTLPFGYTVSTVHLVIDHGFGLKHDPIIFETMVFDPSGLSVDCARYATIKEAEEGHEAMVKRHFVIKRTLDI